MTHKTKIVLLSGGIDSTTCLKLAVDRHGERDVTALSIAYGQKHIAELEAAELIAGKLGVEHLVLQLPTEIMAGGRSTLVEGGPENPVSYYADLPHGVSPTYVPFRNGNLISLAAAYAMKIEADEIWFGAHAEDAENWAYPDCTPEFIGSMANAVWVGTYHKTRLVTPLEWLTKVQIVRLGLEHDAPYELTMSCYNGQAPACGKCPTCHSRRDAFAQLGHVDPIEYELVGV